MKNINLNTDCFIQGGFGEKDEPLQDYGMSDGKTSVYFRDLEKKLIGHIKDAGAVFGCIAWLTNYKILDELSNKQFVSIVVQKEDFLKPDLKNSSEWKAILKSKYDQIPDSIYRSNLPYPVNDLSYGSCGNIEGVRCVGNNNTNKNPSFPRMHNKFLVFAKATKTKTGCPIDIRFLPYAVWSGSFNLSYCASMSFENAIFIKNKKISEAYFKEYCQILALSEKLDWRTDWIQPEWRIGS